MGKTSHSALSAEAACGADNDGFELWNFTRDYIRRGRHHRAANLLCPEGRTRHKTCKVCCYLWVAIQKTGALGNIEEIGHLNIGKRELAAGEVFMGAHGTGDAVTRSPSTITGALPRGCTAASAGGALKLAWLPLR